MGRAGLVCEGRMGFGQVLSVRVAWVGQVLSVRATWVGQVLFLRAAWVGHIYQYQFTKTVKNP